MSKFRDIMLGRSFILVAGPKSLVGLFREDRPTAVMAAAWIQRWPLLLRAYNYKIVYRPRLDNQQADALSRLPIETSEEATDKLPLYVLSIKQFDDTNLSSQVSRKLSEKDKVLRAGVYDADNGSAP